MLNQDFEIEICVKTCDMNSTLGSVVPLAMFFPWAGTDFRGYEEQLGYGT